MKNKIYILFFALASSISAKAQVDDAPWCPAGATWIYESFEQWNEAYYSTSISLYQFELILN